MLERRERQAHLVRLLAWATVWDVAYVVCALMVSAVSSNQVPGRSWMDAFGWHMYSLIVSFSGIWWAAHVLLGGSVLVIVHATARRRSDAAFGVAIFLHMLPPLLLLLPIRVFSASGRWLEYLLLLAPLSYAFCPLLLVGFRRVFPDRPMRWTAVAVACVPAILVVTWMAVPWASRRLWSMGLQVTRLVAYVSERRAPRVRIVFEDTRGEEGVALETLISVVPQEPGSLDVRCALEVGGRTVRPTSMTAFVRVLAAPSDGRVHDRPVSVARVAQGEVLYLRCTWSLWRPDLAGENVIRVRARRGRGREATAAHVLRRGG